MIVRAIARRVSGRAWARFEGACRAPEAAQAALWERTRTLLAAAPFWRGRLTTRLEDMPITRYEDYRAVLAEDQAKTTSQLNGEPLMFWAESSGTTGTPKLFPITPTYRKQFQTVNLPFVHGLIRRFPTFLAKQVLYLTSPGPTTRSAGGIGVGFISGFNYLHTPWPLSTKLALPRAVLADAATYAREAAIHAAAADVGAVLAVTPARIRLLAEEIAARKGDILAALPRLSLAPARARAIRDALAQPRLDLTRLWPSLEVVGAWKTSACALQLPSLDAYLPPSVARVDVIYSATEGWVNVPFRSDVDGGPLHPGGMLCEFLDGERIVKPWELEVGKDYELLMTNTMGLVRYRLFDVVRCSGFFHRSPELAFVGKAARELVVGMIRVSEAQLVDALQGTPLGAHPGVVFAPREDGDGLVLWIRGKDGIPIDGIPTIDDRLRELNAYYRRDVGSKLFAPLEGRMLSADDPLWAELSGNAQTKPRLYLDRPIVPRPG